MYGTFRKYHSDVPHRAGRSDAAPADEEAVRTAEVLRRAGGALPVARLRGALEDDSAEPLARCLRRRSDLFLVVDRQGGPWRDQEWTPAERAEYERGALSAADEHVVLVDGGARGERIRAPVLLRESLLSMWGETPQDEEIRRELARAVEFGDAAGAPRSDAA